MQKRIRLIILLSALSLSILAQTSAPPLPFPEPGQDELASENLSGDTELPYSVRAFHYKKGLYTAVTELERTISENSTLSQELVTMIVAVVASRNRCLY